MTRSALAPDDLIDLAAEGYYAAFPHSELVEFDDHGVSYLFDLTDASDADRTPRVVAAWGISSVPAGGRKRSRQAGFPLSTELAARGYERGHLLAHATGGGLDENLFAQASDVNQGCSPAGRAYRRLERLASSHPGCLLFHRLIYGDGTEVPDLTQLTIALSGTLYVGTFDNRPRPTPDRLVRGQQFHRRVQTAFLAGLVGASASPEHVLNLHTGRRRRLDLLILPQTAGEVTAVVVEVKNSEWDDFRSDRVRPNLRRHINQLQGYLDYYVDQIRQGHRELADHLGTSQPVSWDAVIGVLLYPRRPRISGRAQLIEDLAFQQALTIVWYDETDWPNDEAQLPHEGPAAL